MVPFTFSLISDFVFYSFQKLSFGEHFLFLSEIQIVSSADTARGDDLGWWWVQALMTGYVK